MAEASGKNAVYDIYLSYTAKDIDAKHKADLAAEGKPWDDKTMSLVDFFKGPRRRDTSSASMRATSCTSTWATKSFRGDAAVAARVHFWRLACAASNEKSRCTARRRTRSARTSRPR